MIAYNDSTSTKIDTEIEGATAPPLRIPIKSVSTEQPKSAFNIFKQRTTKRKRGKLWKEK